MARRPGVTPRSEFPRPEASELSAPMPLSSGGERVLVSSPPRRTALAVEVDGTVEWRRQPCHSEALRAEPSRQRDRCRVGRVDRMHDIAPAEMVECPVHASRDRLGRVPPSPDGSIEGPADFLSGPPFRLPWPGTADPATRYLLQNGEIAESVDDPSARHERQIPPCARWRLRPTDEPGRFRIRKQRGPWLEILLRRGPEDEAIGLERGAYQGTPSRRFNRPSTCRH